VPGKGRAWLDFANDVTVKDVKLAAQEGYASVEHMKRYTTQGMAPDQGKNSNVGALAVLAGLALADAGARRHLMHVAAVVALLGALAPAAALAIRAAQMSPLALGVNVGMLALSAALFAMMIRSFVVARRSRTAG
jgi:hypothetical protein